MLPAPRIARTIAHRTLRRRDLERLEGLRWHDAGHGYDVLGMHPDWVAMGVGLTRFLYESWFRVTSHGGQHLPREGAAILAANHSGTLPFDAILLYGDVVRHTSPPRIPRIAMDLFVPRLPFISTFFARCGGVNGTRATVRRLLGDGELVGIFPEGTPGIGKPFSERYRLQGWRVGHAELALLHRVPVIPTAIIGAEEMWPQLAKIERLHPFGAPWLPIPASPVPMPVHVHVWYGEPIHLHERYDPEEVDDPTMVEAAAGEVRVAVQSLIERGLEERRGVFT